MKTALTKDQQKAKKEKEHILRYLAMHSLDSKPCSQQYSKANMYYCLSSNSPHPIAAEQAIFVKSFIKTAANYY